MRIGIDLGGTKIEAIALDEAGATLLRRRVPTPAGDYTRPLSTVADLVATAEKCLGAGSRTSYNSTLGFRHWLGIMPFRMVSIPPSSGRRMGISSGVRGAAWLWPIVSRG